MYSSQKVVIYDAEFWTDEGVMHRHWEGLDDYPPVLIQIGALKVQIAEGLPLLESFVCYVQPQNEFGENLPITDYFTKLTRITQKDITEKGTALQEALDKFAAFAGDCKLYSYGSDEFCSLLPSCYLADIPMPFKAPQMKDIRLTFRRAGMEEKRILDLNSGALASYFGIPIEGHHEHDARDDAHSILVSLRHLEKQGKLSYEWFKETR